MIGIPDTIVVPDDPRIIRHRVSWVEYERILAGKASNTSPRFTYDRGTLEIARFTAWQESTNRTLALVVNLAASALHLDIRDLGSATYLRRDLQRGFDPDSSFSIQHAPSIVGKCEITLPGDPPPDLMIDIAAMGVHLDKLPMYVDLGVPEVWRYDEARDRVTILRLRHRVYRERRESAALVPLTDDLLTRLVHTNRIQPSHLWVRELESWLRAYD